MSNLTNSRLEVSDLKLIQAIGANRNLSRAAQQMGLALSTISRQLQALEAKLEQALILRGKRMTELTPAGALLLARADLVLQELSEIEQDLIGAIKAKPLRVQGTFGFGRQFLAPIIAQYCRLHPQQRIQLELADRDPQLLDDRFDIAVRFGKPPDRAVVAKKIAANRRFIVASPSYLRSLAKPIREPEDLAKVRCVTLNQDNDRYSLWPLVNLSSKPRLERSIRIDPMLASNHGEVVKQWAIEGLGVALRSEFDVAPDIAAGKLVRILPDWQGALGDIYAMYKPKSGPTSRPEMSAIVQFLTYLQQQLRERLNAL